MPASTDENEPTAADGRIDARPPRFDVSVQARHAAQVERLMRHVDGILGSISALSEQVRSLQPTLRGLHVTGREVDPIRQLTESTTSTGREASLQGLDLANSVADAMARGRDHLQEMVLNNELVSGPALADAWHMQAQELVEAETRHELFSLTVESKRYYMAELLHLEPHVVAAISVALYPMEAWDKCVFWRRRHGSLSGMTIMERLAQGDWRSDLDAVLDMAWRYADEDRMGIALRTGR